MPLINNIVRFPGHLLVILILLGTLSALSLSSAKWIESKSKQTEINLNQEANSDTSEEKSNYELEESLLNSSDDEHKFNLCYSKMYYKYQNVSLIDGLSGLNTPPPRSC